MNQATNLLERVPSHDVTMEQCVLGCMLISPEAARVVLEMLKVDDFYIQKHRSLFVNMSDMFRRTGNLDEAIVVSALERNRRIEAVGGRDYIGNLIMITPSAAGVENYCNAVLSCAADRAAMKKGQELLKAATEGRGKEVLEGRSVGVIRGSVEAMDREIEEAKAGLRYCVPLPFPQLHKCTRALTPGTLTALCGVGGSAKSLWMNQVGMALHSDYPTAILELEDGVVFHTRRALAQITGRHEITQDEWFTKPENAAEYEALKIEHAETLKSFTKSIYELHHDEQPTLEFAYDWVRARCAEGCRVIAVDPFTMLTTSQRNLVEEQGKFVVNVIRLMRRYKASFIMVTHPKTQRGKDRGYASMDDLAGTPAVRNFARCILWYKAHAQKEMDCRLHKEELGGVSRVETRTVNRTITVLKANNSYGTGMQIGFYFDKKSLCVEEQGIIE